MNKEVNPACVVIRRDQISDDELHELRAVLKPGAVIELDDETVLRSVPLKSFWYLATPYSKYAKGKEKAYEDACKVTAYLISHGMLVFCPIAHTHGPAAHIGEAKDTHETWLGADLPFIIQSTGMIIVKMPGWDESYGVKWEIEKFRELKKPICFIEFPIDETQPPRITPFAG